MNKHSHNSSFREKLIEHLFVSDLLKFAWKEEDCRLEISRPEVDNAGYDLIVESHNIVRHIQLKSSLVGGKTAKQKIHKSLSEKPSGCIVWTMFDESAVELGPFLFFGGGAGEPLPSLMQAKVAKHTKGNKDGFKAERPNIVELNKGQFKTHITIESLFSELFVRVDT